MIKRSRAYVPFRASVVIPAYNAEAWIGEQLEALVNQAAAPPFEVIVADNGSTDGTVQVSEQYAGRLALTVVNASRLPGASHARNEGAARARTELLLFCDADDIVDAHWVSALLQAHDESGAALIAGALHHERFNSPEILAGYGIGPDPVVDDSVPAFVEDPPPFAGYLPTAAGGNMAVTTRAYCGAGGMDPSYPGGSEETAFAWKVQEMGFRIVSCPRAVVHYRLKKTARDIARQQFIQQRARIYLWTRFRHSTMVGPSAKSSAFHLLRSCAGFVASSLGRGRSRARRAWSVGAHAGALAGIFRYRLRPALERKAASLLRTSPKG